MIGGYHIVQKYLVIFPTYLPILTNWNKKLALNLGPILHSFGILQTSGAKGGFSPPLGYPIYTR